MNMDPEMEEQLGEETQVEEIEKHLENLGSEDLS
jgi:hypothetical protein